VDRRRPYIHPEAPSKFLVISRSYGKNFRDKIMEKKMCAIFPILLLSFLIQHTNTMVETHGLLGGRSITDFLGKSMVVKKKLLTKQSHLWRILWLS